MKSVITPIQNLKTVIKPLGPERLLELEDIAREAVSDSALGIAQEAYLTAFPPSVGLALLEMLKVEHQRNQTLVDGLVKANTKLREMTLHSVKDAKGDEGPGAA